MANAGINRFQTAPLLNNCSRIFFKYIIYMILICDICRVSTACEFPHFLETRANWTATYNDKGTLHAYFKENVMKASRCHVKGNCYEYTRKCLKKQNNKKFEVQHYSREGRLPPMYLCMQIIQRAKSIIQIRESQKVYFRSPCACDDNLILDDWPLVTTEDFEEQKIPCPFSGGYNIRIHTSNKQPKCGARLESECEQGDGMTINFQNRNCLETDLEMNVKQSLYCAASWTHGNNTFVILRPQNDDFKAWCMRIAGTDFSKPFEHGYLFVDLVCDPGDGNGNIREMSKYLYVEFKQQIFSSSCDDSYVVTCNDYRLCQYNDEIYSVNCQRFCNYCSSDQSQCTLLRHFQGSWAGYSDGEQNQVTISDNEIEINGMDQFQCQESEIHDFEKRTVLLKTFSNGCFPRYVCFEGKKVSSSILEYRLGNGIIWPVKNLDSLKKDVCDDQLFEPSAVDREMFGRNTKGKPTTILVNIEHHFPVSCNLQNWPGMLVNRLYIQEVDVCDYCFVYDANSKGSQHKFVAQPLNCTYGKTLDRTDYHCLGVFPQDDNNTYAVVTVHVHQEYLCWVFVHEDDNDDRAGIIYVLDATNCNTVAINAVKVGRSNPKRTFVIPTSLQSSMCNNIQSSASRVHINENIFTLFVYTVMLLKAAFNMHI